MTKLVADKLLSSFKRVSQKVSEALVYEGGHAFATSARKRKRDIRCDDGRKKRKVPYRHLLVEKVHAPDFLARVSSTMEWLRSDSTGDNREEEDGSVVDDNPKPSHRAVLLSNRSTGDKKDQISARCGHDCCML